MGGKAWKASVGIAGSFAEGVQEEAKEKSPLRHYLAYPDNSKTGSIN